MANVDAPSGARVVGSKSGYHEGQLTRMVILAGNGTATFVNDIVTLGGDADANGVPSIVVGIVASFEVDGSNLELKHRLASTERYALVNTDPNVLFELQEDSVGGALTTASIGLNTDITVGAGSTTSGLSGIELDSSLAATTSTLVVHIESLMPREDNALGTNAKFRCSFNVHQMGGVGVAGV